LIHFYKRLCDFASLKKSRLGRDRTDSSSEDTDSGEKKSKKKEPKVKSRLEAQKKALGDISSNESESDKNPENDDDDSDREVPKEYQSQNDLAKAAVLASSSDESQLSDKSSDQENKELEVKPKPEKVKNQRFKNLPTSDEDSGDKKEKKRQHRPALLSMKLSESDSGTSEDEKKYRAKMEKRAEAMKDRLENDDSLDSDSVLHSGKKKKGMKKQKILSSDDTQNSESEESDSEEDQSSDSSDILPKSKKSKSKRRKDSSSDDDSDSESDEKPKKRRRIKQGSDDSDDEKDSPTKGRHNIKKIIKDKYLEESTKHAAEEERKRRQRIEERQKIYNSSFNTDPDDKINGVDSKDKVLDQLVLDFDTETKEVLVEVEKALVKQLKPHQGRGIKFMWDAVMESVEIMKSGKRPGGAILAHCMGLGKTLQSISLLHTCLSYTELGIERAMVICPVNTVKNWYDEFDKWLKGKLEVDVYEMSDAKSNWGRVDKLNQWFREGGVLIIGYDMFRNLTNEKNQKFKKKQKDCFDKCLLDPGPDLVICDEGHLLKNEKSAINKAVNRIKTPSRIVLTGTPLQNNLKEYFEMVNFVKPSLLGTRKEFMNRFVNPIVNGQHSDSTERDIKTMKKRSFILNDLLKGCMQRLDYNVLVPYLQPKKEYVILINMSDLQKTLYKYYLENYAKAGQIGSDGKLEGGKKGGLFYDVQNLSKIWNHPSILILAKQRKDEKQENDEEEDEMKDFINDDSDDGEDSDIQELESDGTVKTKPLTRGDNGSLVDGLEDGASSSSSKGWWDSLAGDQDMYELKFGGKMMLLMDILKECALIGDKVLVFSQSLLSLDLIEDFLARANDAHEGKVTGVSNGMDDYLDTWIQGKDYYRMDGSTGADTRKLWCKYFNRSTSHRMRLFLISTKAGGLGINLVAANRVVIFDASWNPSHDVQSIFRVFRFGQTKPVYIYRFLAKGTMEEKIYDRQVTKQSLSARVVDEQQIERHFTMNELSELYEFNDEPACNRPVPLVPEDRLLAELTDKHKDLVWSIHHHDSLLENKVDENLTEEERKHAWEEYEQEKKGTVQTNIGIENTQQFGLMLQQMLPKSGDGRIMASPINPMAIQMQLKQLNPELSHEELVQRTRAAIMQLQNMHRTQTPVIVDQKTLNVGGQRQTTGYDQSYYQAEMAKAKAMINKQYPGMYRSRFRAPNPHAPGMGPGVMPVPRMRQQAHSEVITLDDSPGPQPRMRMPSIGLRAPMRGMPLRPGGRGGKRGRPRLDPDTDLDFSPEPQAPTNSEALLARLQQAGMSVSATASPRNNSGNES